MLTENKRSNVWCCVFYPDSMPSNYLSIIKYWHIPCLLSPIHNADKNGDESEKKTHYHLMLYFGVGANKSKKQVMQYTSQLNGTDPIIVNNTNAMIRYFIHKDNPEKSQRSKGDKKDWDINSLMAISGFEYKQAFENYTTDEQMYNFVEDFINTNVIYNYADLIYYLKKHNCYYEAMFVRKHTLYFDKYLTGVYHKITRKMINDND